MIHIEWIKPRGGDTRTSLLGRNLSTVFMHIKEFSGHNTDTRLFAKHERKYNFLQQWTQQDGHSCSVAEMSLIRTSPKFNAPPIRHIMIITFVLFKQDYQKNTTLTKDYSGVCPMIFLHLLTITTTTIVLLMHSPIQSLLETTFSNSSVTLSDETITVIN